MKELPLIDSHYEERVQRLIRKTLCSHSNAAMAARVQAQRKSLEEVVEEVLLL